MITDLTVRDMDALERYLSMVSETPIQSGGMNDEILEQIHELASSIERGETTVEKAALTIFVDATGLQTELLPILSVLSFIANGDDEKTPAPLSRFAQLMPGDILSRNEAISYQLIVLYHLFSDIASAPGIVSQAEAAI